MTIVAVHIKMEPPPRVPDAPCEKFLGLRYGDMEVDGRLRCSFSYREGDGAEFRGKSMGSTQMIVAYGRSTYWFWMRHYDPKNYYFCPSPEEIDPSIIPPLRPSFSRWMINREADGSRSFADGPYTVEISVRDGLVTAQRYFLDGSLELEVRVTAFQERSGMKFPAAAKIRMPRESVDIAIDMGEAEVNPKSMPDFSPPRGLNGISLVL